MTTKTCQGDECRSILHASDCSVHNGPAFPNGPCDCTERGPRLRERLRRIRQGSVLLAYWPLTLAVLTVLVAVAVATR